jgi:hypothetical protein
MPTDRDLHGMSHPDIVQSALGDESVAARVDLGDDALYVTGTRTILYRADKLLSDESVEEFPHGAERISVSSGRRKATLTLDYGLDGERSFSVPAKAVDRALHPVLAGTLNATGVTDPGETIKETFRFSELTLVITSDRLVKHVGNAVWDEEFEAFDYDDVTDLAFEEGSVATTLVVSLGRRQERFKAPNERAREVRERLMEAVLDHHGLDSLETLRERFGVEEADSPSSRMSFGDGPTPLSVNPGELPDRPANATRPDEGGVPDRTVPPAAAEHDRGPTAGAVGPTGEADDATATEPTGTHEADTDETPVDRQAAGTAETPADAPPTETSERGTTDAGDDSEEGGGFDVSGTDDLLGPADEGDADPTMGSAVDGVDDSDSDLAALVAEVEALRESVDAQNERLTRQEELIERLVVELRNRL